MTPIVWENTTPRARTRFAWRGHIAYDSDALHDVDGRDEVAFEIQNWRECPNDFFLHGTAPRIQPCPPFRESPPFVFDVDGRTGALLDGGAAFPNPVGAGYTPFPSLEAAQACAATLIGPFADHLRARQAFVEALTPENGVLVEALSDAAVETVRHTLNRPVLYAPHGWGLFVLGPAEHAAAGRIRGTYARRRIPKGTRFRLVA